MDIEIPSLGWPTVPGDGLLTIDYFRASGLSYHTTSEADIGDPLVTCRHTIGHRSRLSGNPVACHPASRRRSCHRLVVRAINLRRDLHPRTAGYARRTKSRLCHEPAWSGAL